MTAPSTRFCVACGVALVPEARYCAACGTAATAPASGHAPAPAMPMGERREVTVLFADLAAFTRLSAERDPEDMHRLLNRLFAVVDRIVVDHGGTVDKHMGDAVMAVFGAPVAHGNDPERAVRTAIALHEAVAELSARERVPLALHIGVNSGEVVASSVGGSGHESYTVTGDAVNLAARLQDLAAAGETLISDPVRAAVAGRVRTEPLGRRSLRGIVRPVPVWRVLALEASGSVAERTPFVGRSRERRQIADTLDACLESGRGGVILIRGEAGIGKTRLVEEIAGLATARAMACHKALVLDFGVGKGRDPIPALVRGLLGIVPDGTKAERAERAAAAVADGTVERDQLPFLHDLLDLPQPADQRNRFDAMDDAARRRGAKTTVAALAARLAEQTPRLFIVEDLHWADASALEQLAALAASAGDAPLVVVMTSRIEGDPMDQGWRATTRGCPVTTIDLAPLRPDEALALAQGLNREQSAAMRACVERAEGNPLYLEQLIHSLSERAGEALPPTLRSLVLARMDRLPAADKAALQAASVIGQRFGLALVRELTGDPAYRPNGLVRHAVVRPEGEEYLFAHALIRDGVYSSLLNAVKRDLHGRAAAWYEGRDPPLHAQHLERAGDPGAAAAYALAARQAADVYRYDQALALAERGLAIAVDDGERYAILFLKGRVLRDLSRPADSVGAYLAAGALAVSDLDRGRALIGIGAGYRMTGNTAKAKEALDAAAVALERDGLDIDRAELHYLLGNVAFARGEAVACRLHHTEAFAFAERGGDLQWQARALSGLGDAAYAQGRMITAQSCFKRGIDLAIEHGFGRIEQNNRYMFGVGFLYQSEIDAALRELDACIELSRAVHDEHGEMICYAGRAYVFIDAGELDRALADAVVGEAMARRMGAKRYLSVVLAHYSHVLHATGRDAEANERMRECLALCRETSERFFLPAALGYLARQTRDATEREAALTEAEALLAKGCVSHNYYWFYRDGMESALAWREWTRALRYADALATYTAEEPAPLSDFWIARCRALVAFGRGEAGPDLLSELRRLREYALAHRLRAYLPTLDMALVG